MLEAANIPIRAVDRGPEHPLIFGGGPVLTANPEPYADWFDVVLLGDGKWFLCFRVVCGRCGLAILLHGFFGYSGPCGGFVCRQPSTTTLILGSSEEENVRCSEQ